MWVSRTCAISRGVRPVAYYKGLTFERRQPQPIWGNYAPGIRYVNCVYDV